MRLRILLLLAVLAIGGGFVLGHFGPRWLARGSRAAAPVRPPALVAAWRALDGADMPALQEAVRALEPSGMPTAAYREEAELMHVIAGGDRAAVDTFARSHADRTAGAQALGWLIETASTPAERTALEARLRAHHPASWRLPREGRKARPEADR